MMESRKPGFFFLRRFIASSCTAGNYPIAALFLEVQFRIRTYDLQVPFWIGTDTRKGTWLLYVF